MKLNKVNNNETFKISFIVCSNGFGHFKRVLETSISILKLKKDAQTILDALDYSDFDLGIWLTSKAMIRKSLTDGTTAGSEEIITILIANVLKLLNDVEPEV